MKIKYELSYTLERRKSGRVERNGKPNEKHAVVGAFGLSRYDVYTLRLSPRTL